MSINAHVHTIGHRNVALLIMFACLASLSLVITHPGTTGAASMNVHRFYNMRTGSHFYTSNQSEASHVNDHLYTTYRYEGKAFNVYMTEEDSSRVAVYRLYNLRTGAHFYTSSKSEYFSAIRDRRLPDMRQLTFRDEGIAFYAMETLPEYYSGAPPRVHRFYHLQNDTHFYTSNQKEASYINDKLFKTYRYEGSPFSG